MNSNERKCNILHVVNIYFVLPYFIGDQFLHFNSKGLSQYVICSESEYLNEYSRKMNFKYIEVPILRSINIKQDIVSIIAICKYIKANKIDIVVGHTPKGALLAMIASFIMRVNKRVYFRHGLVYETSVGLKRKLLITLDRLSALCATKVVCVSPSVLSRSLEDKLNCSSKQLVLGKGTCTGIDTSFKFNPENLEALKLSNLRDELKIPKSHRVYGYCGRLVKDKGLIELVNAFVKLNKLHSDTCLLLVGMYEERDALPNDIVEVIEGHPNIIVTGFVNSDIEYYYGLMDVYVLPSYREGFPTSILEASSLAKPIITTRVTGCIDAIQECKTGLFTTHDIDDLCDKMQLLLDATMRLKMGYKGRDFVVKNFDSKLVWSELEKLYLES